MQYKTGHGGRMDEMFGDFLDTLLVGGLAILLVGFGFVSVVEGWRRWSDNRRIRKHFRSSGKHRKLAGVSSSIPITGPSLDQCTENWELKPGASLDRASNPAEDAGSVVEERAR
jgi:hypothetical protein